ncbi:MULTISPECIES: twin-arginine translocase TatA/TatE family subunit [Halobacteriovorax]|uniref:Sec-independent protein translocase protein TatA n=1 Tax=Halobacteriovorax vibrionivorans TaxID=2152716 RepID=A0ABY0IBM1_9BACT|nr:MULTISPECIES: twin-arginine translocase TatA/TatE family subunit [Halobacteriovorax]AYF44396.1 MttA family protein [Halobacteriovorax sp. BALOs_7]RZF20363.1 twin-arginine translocase TatA/TatE family subunit [Halobacteriovorax vibrionivorans]TGD46536.1 twin-arginine translocase TatA/TatE family subunit [Halobacteriovorax sp. Y22]
MFGGFGAGELLIVLVFALIFIGPKKLPELAKGLGKGLREFQKAKDDLMDHVNDAAEQNSAATEKVADQSTQNDAQLESGQDEVVDASQDKVEAENPKSKDS